MCKKIEILEDDFIRGPSNLANYMLRITEELHKVGTRMIQEMLEDPNEMLNESIIRKKKWCVDCHEQKQLITSLGTVSFRKTLFKDKISGKRAFMLDCLLQMESHERLKKRDM